MSYSCAVVYKERIKGKVKMEKFTNWKINLKKIIISNISSLKNEIVYLYKV